MGGYSCCSTRASHCSGFSRCRAWALGHAGFSSCSTWVSSCGSQALEHRLSSCGARAQLLRSMWDLPGSEIEPVSPAFVGRFFFFTTEPPGKPFPPCYIPNLFPSYYCSQQEFFFLASRPLVFLSLSLSFPNIIILIFFLLSSKAIANCIYECFHCFLYFNVHFSLISFKFLILEPCLFSLL